MEPMGIFKRKLPSGNYMYYLAYRDKNGKRRHVSLGTSNRKEALKIAKQIEEELKQASLPNTITASLFETEYFTWLKDTHTPKTYETYKLAWDKFTAHVGKEKRLDRITTRDIDLWVQKEKEKGNSPNTINKDLRALKAIFNKAREWGHIQQNPFSKYKLLPAPDAKLRYLSEQEIKKLLSVIDDEKFKLFVAFALYSGCRRNEILALTWDCVDWQGETIRAYNYKTKKPKMIPLTPALKTVLVNMQKYTQVGYIFPRWSPDWISHKFKKYARKAGLPDVRFHDLRHTYATYLVLKGVPINVVKDLVGHTNIATTMIYLHAAEDIKKEAASKMDVALELLDGNNKVAKC